MVTKDNDKKSAGTRKGLLGRVGLLLAAVAVMVYVMPRHEATRYQYEVGKPWSYAQLIAPFDVPVHRDSADVSRQLDSLRAAFPPVYAPVRVNVDSIVDTAVKQMDIARRTQEGTGVITMLLSSTDLSGFEAAMRQRLYRAYRKDAVVLQPMRDMPRRIRILSGNRLQLLSTDTLPTTHTLLEEINTMASSYDCQSLVAASKLDILLKPSVSEDKPETQRLFDAEALKFSGDLGVIMAGQTIVNKGAVVTPQDYINIQTYEQMVSEQVQSQSGQTWMLLTGQYLYLLLLMGLIMLYLYLYERPVWDRMRSVVFIVVLVTLLFTVTALLGRTVHGGMYLSPLAITAVLLTTFINGRTALWTSALLALMCAPMATFAMEFIFLQVTACSAAVFSLRQLTRRSQLMRSALYIAVAYLAAYLLYELMMNGTPADMTVRMAVMLVASALMTCIAYVVMPGIEKAFGFVSNVTLVELADVSSPLLMRLSEECPGTFQHVMAVSNLAADAARRIGANDLLARAGAMYHDIGKLSNPMFFTENQHGVNPHDGLPPEQSARIIINHVTDGMQRAAQAGLPTVIRDFITQHHGAGKAKYFYFTYCKAHPGEEVDPAPFTYPGPNPRTRETAVLMMADAVEAASRSLKEHTPKAIADLVNKIIDSQIADGLLADAPLSFRDIRDIKDTFVKRLMTMYHSRIAYPDDPNRKKQ